MSYGQGRQRRDSSRLGSGDWSGDPPPRPDDVQTLEDLTIRLRALLAWSGMSYREVHRWVTRLRTARGIEQTTAYSTVYRAFQPGRRRLELDLVVDIAHVLLGDVSGTAEWRRAHQLATGPAVDAAAIDVRDSLPVDDSSFVGRKTELDTLVEWSKGSRAPILISGMAGAGKTRLAVRAAHEILKAEQMRGPRQVFVNLHGFDRRRAQADPATVLAGVLRRLGASARHLHSLDLSARTALYHELVAKTDGIVLLDDAASEDQVRPLLSTATRCLVMITSRRELAGLPNVRKLGLAGLAQTDALDLLGQAAGSARISADIDNAKHLVDAVGRLPLAVSLVASRMQAQPDWTVSDHLEQVSDSQARLSLDSGIERTLRLSYESAEPRQRRALRLLGIHPARNFDSLSIARLMDESPQATERALEELCTVNLLIRQGADRFELHDLVRLFAAGRAREEEAPSVRRAALGRLYDYYRTAVSRAMDLYAPHEAHRRIRFDGAPTPAGLTDATAAAAWLDAERANLITAASYAADHRAPDFTVDMSALLHRYLDTTAHYSDADALHRCAIDVAQDIDKARIRSRLGTLHARLGDYATALAHYTDALTTFRELGDLANEGRTLNNLAITNERLGYYPAAVRFARDALSIAQRRADPTSTGRALSNLGITQARLGHDAEAEQALRAALSQARAAANRSGESYALTHLAIVEMRQQRHSEAVAGLQQALAIAREVSDRVGEAYALTHLGTACAIVDDPQALKHHRLAVDIAREIGDRDSEAEALNALGMTLTSAGRPQDAQQAHIEGLAVAEATGHRYQQARAYAGLAKAHRLTGAPANAERVGQKANDLFRALGTPEAG